ncbi:alpha/beta superfamily hydrolase (macronuclear) [Tetrahymena thermophila SB210]|uniref:Alpha/beta superfamily hydrolase n=1 Tax=Tetrahymena thermophila (strain SB210) TaxID=312017 RepID=W7XK01_TETTS|nr:alpha/beta superfamily hydrolase [Tetrahymena thermophila SB210]EWS76096.1 alpha/beta superfamily hydrolase [Tetrahymena thermophila SB210]|eukprot:XP_012651336.1 alpha/beta superfamily hydrolase [Tetrahymena thermophila SB210]
MMLIKSTKLNQVNNLVVLHGLCGQPSNFIEFANQKQIISQVNSHLLDWHTQKFNINTQSLYLRDYIKNITNGQICLLGHSLGAKIIMNTLTQHKQQLEDKVKGAIIVDMQPFTQQREGKETKKLGIMKLYLGRVQNLNLADKNEEQVLNEIESVVPSKRIARILLQNYNIEAQQWRVDIDDILHNYDDFLYHDIQGSWQGRVIILAGKRSVIVSRSQFDPYKSIFSQIDLQRDIKFIKKANHWVYNDKPTLFANEVSNFLKEIFDEKHS